MATIQKIGGEAAFFETIRQLIAKKEYQSAQKKLNEYNLINAQGDAEWYYRLGNLYYSAFDFESANQAWGKSASLSNPPENKISLDFNLKPILWRTIGAVTAILFGLYFLIVLLFPREPDLRQLMLGSQQQQENQSSFWDRFWSNDRFSLSQRAIENGELWYVLSEEFKSLFGLFSDKEMLELSTNEQLIEFLNQIRNQSLLRRLGGSRPITSKIDYYLLASKGYFDLKKFKEANEILELGLYEAKSPSEEAQIYYEMATIHYFQGYQLQPDGLAKYNLDQVRKSVAAYEKAQEYIKSPFLFGNLGWGYYLLADYRRSVHYGKQALQMDDRIHYVRMNIGIAYLRIHDYQNSFEIYQELSKFDPAEIDYNGGIRDLEELVRDYPGQYDFAYFILGYIYFVQENYKKSKDYWDVFKNSPFSEAAWKNKARKMIDSKLARF